MGELNHSTRRIDLLQKLLKIDTSNGEETQLAEVLAACLSTAGIETRLERVDEKRSNLFARLPGKCSGNSLMFNAHMDTVPAGKGWSRNPFGAEVSEGKVYGRGASDTKSALAAMAAAMIELSAESVSFEKDLVLLGTAGEETDFAGAKAFASSGGMEGVGCLVVGEPTNNRGSVLCLDVVNATKGSYVGILRTKGTSAHGASPDAGINAIFRMAQFLEFLRNNPPYSGCMADSLLGPPTWAPTVIQGGDAENMIPDTCVATLDIRPTPGMSELEALEPFRLAAGQLWGHCWQDCIEVSGRNFLPPIKCEAGDPVVKMALRCAAELGMTCEVRSFFGACDASFLRTNQELPFFIFGPGIEQQAHKPDEYVRVEDYFASIEFYKQFAFRRLGG